MFKDDFEAAAGAAAAKSSFLKRNPMGYIVLSILAGMYIGFGILLSFTVGGLMAGAPAAKLAMGATFGVALSLVVMAGSELFTGNNLVMFAGLLKKKTTLSNCITLWIVCWLGNMCGGVLLALLFHLSGLGNGPVGDFMAKTALAKMSAPAIELLSRGILCNMLVCIAVWCGFRCKTESGKLIMIFWCLIAFFTAGFEHSVANMTLLTYSLFNPAGQAVSFAGEMYNLCWVTLGNMIGGIVFVALPYFISQRD
ncbi:MAG: formate/nitrite transporter family protein [Spirochaetales bacterium]|nr:formate/nitrite transporter family protein [Spirochaetales bacterium]